MSTFSQQLKGVIRGESPTEKILTPKIEAWYGEHPGGKALSRPVAERMAQLMASDANSDRSGRFGASSRGGCLRAQMFSFHGETAVWPSRTSRVFADGTWRHLRWQAQGLEAGWWDEVEYGAAVPEFYVRVSADAVNTAEGWGFELKGTSNLTGVISNGVPHAHKLQIHTMMLATGLDVWVYVAECKRTQEFVEFVVRRDPAIEDEVLRELAELKRHVDEGTMPDPLTSCVARKGPDWRGCPYKDVCLEVE